MSLNLLENNLVDLSPSKRRNGKEENVSEAAELFSTLGKCLKHKREFLAEHAVKLGISKSGTKNELCDRIRKHYKDLNNEKSSPKKTSPKKPDSKKSESEKEMFSTVLKCMKHKKDVLTGHAKKLGLDVSGTKEELCKRIGKHYKSGVLSENKEEREEEREEKREEKEEHVSFTEDFNDTIRNIDKCVEGNNLAELKAQADKFGLKISGTKKALCERILNYKKELLEKHARDTLNLQESSEEERIRKCTENKMVELKQISEGLNLKMNKGETKENLCRRIVEKSTPKKSKHAPIFASILKKVENLDYNTPARKERKEDDDEEDDELDFSGAEESPGYDFYGQREEIDFENNSAIKDLRKEFREVKLDKNESFSVRDSFYPINTIDFQEIRLDLIPGSSTVKHNQDEHELSPPFNEENENLEKLYKRMTSIMSQVLKSSKDNRKYLYKSASPVKGFTNSETENDIKSKYLDHIQYDSQLVKRESPFNKFDFVTVVLDDKKKAVRMVCENFQDRMYGYYYFATSVTRCAVFMVNGYINGPFIVETNNTIMTGLAIKDSLKLSTVTIYKAPHKFNSDSIFENIKLDLHAMFETTFSVDFVLYGIVEMLKNLNFDYDTANPNFKRKLLLDDGAPVSFETAAVIKNSLSKAFAESSSFENVIHFNGRNGSNNKRKKINTDNFGASEDILDSESFGGRVDDDEIRRRPIYLAKRRINLDSPQYPQYPQYFEPEEYEEEYETANKRTKIYDGIPLPTFASPTKWQLSDDESDVDEPARPQNARPTVPKPSNSFLSLFTPTDTRESVREDSPLEPSESSDESEEEKDNGGILTTLQHFFIGERDEDKEIIRRRKDGGRKFGGDSSREPKAPSNNFLSIIDNDDNDTNAARKTKRDLDRLERARNSPEEMQKRDPSVFFILNIKPILTEQRNPNLNPDYVYLILFNYTKWFGRSKPIFDLVPSQYQSGNLYFRFKTYVKMNSSKVIEDLGSGRGPSVVLNEDGTYTRRSGVNRGELVGPNTPKFSKRTLQITPKSFSILRDTIQNDIDSIYPLDEDVSRKEFRKVIEKVSPCKNREEKEIEVEDIIETSHRNFNEIVRNTPRRKSRNSALSGSITDIPFSTPQSRKRKDEDSDDEDAFFTSNVNFNAESNANESAQIASQFKNFFQNNGRR